MKIEDNIIKNDKILGTLILFYLYSERGMITMIKFYNLDVIFLQCFFK